MITTIDELLPLGKPNFDYVRLPNNKDFTNTKHCAFNKYVVCQYDVVSAPRQGIWFCVKMREVQIFLRRVQMDTNRVQKNEICLGAV